MTPEEKALLNARPACCSPEDWREWSKSKTANYGPNVVDQICVDCTPEYKAKMMAQGRCDWPCVEFFLVPMTHEGRVIGNSVEGRRMSIKTYRGTAEGQKIIRIVDSRRGVYDLEPEKPKT